MADKLLTPLEVKNAAPGAILKDGGGLFYRATAKGNGRWVFRFTSKDPGYLAAQAAKGSKSRQREMGLGGFPDVKLATAREKAQHAREYVTRGLDPIEEAEREARAARLAAETAASAATFGTYADETFIPWKIKSFHNQKHIYQWKHTFTHHAKDLRSMKLADITREDILSVLEPIWEDKHVTAARVRGRLEALFDHAIQNSKYRQDNPARWELFNATLKPPQKLTNGHLSAMPWSEVPAFVAALRQRTGSGALALEFAILSASRSGEVRLARWDEFNFEQKRWTIPARRMKTRRDTKRRDHIVPLTDRMIAILEVARAHCINAPTGNDYVFQGGKRGEPMSDMTLRAVMRRMGIKDHVPHGFRSSFRDWISEETDYDPALAEEALAHQLSEVQAAYKRGQAVERRRVMMEAWGAYCDGRVGQGKAINVVPMWAANGE